MNITLVVLLLTAAPPSTPFPPPLFPPTPPSLPPSFAPFLPLSLPPPLHYCSVSQSVHPSIHLRLFDEGALRDHISGSTIGADDHTLPRPSYPTRNVDVFTTAILVLYFWPRAKRVGRGLPRLLVGGGFQTPCCEAYSPHRTRYRFGHSYRRCHRYR